MSFGVYVLFDGTPVRLPSAVIRLLAFTSFHLGPGENHGDMIK